jgi:hypothetical protein
VALPTTTESVLRLCPRQHHQLLTPPPPHTHITPTDIIDHDDSRSPLVSASHCGGLRSLFFVFVLCSFFPSLQFITMIHEWGQGVWKLLGPYMGSEVAQVEDMVRDTVESILQPP